MRSIKTQIVGSNPERTRLHNRRLVLEQVRSLQPVGRAQIARATHLSVQAVSNIIAELQSDGWLKESGRSSRGRGLPALLYTVKASGAAALGVEVRPDAVMAALVDLSGTTRFTDRMDLSSTDPAHVAAIVRDLKLRALSASKLAAHRLLGAGVVMPGPFGQVGLSDAGQSTLPNWSGTDAQALFTTALKVPVMLEHDSAAAALAERVGGVATEVDDYCFIYFGTGVGLGMMHGGRIHRGAFGNAGELGHVVVEPNGNPCACGNKGCLETYISRFSVQQHMLKEGIDVNSSEQFQAIFDDRHPALMQWMASAATRLAQAIGMLENLMDPQTIILGGAFPDDMFDYWINSMRMLPGTVAERPNRSLARVVRGASGRMTASYGGAALILNDVFTPRLAAAS
ncbi:MAG: ROK family protein [Granulosicoccus sp.]